MSGSDVARYPNLWKRRDAYYVRVRVPADVRPHERREHIVVSLRTGDLRTAVRLYRVEQAKIEAQFDCLRARNAPQADFREKMAAWTEKDVAELVATWRASARHPLEGGGDDPRGTLAELREERADLADPAPEVHRPLVGYVADRLLLAAGAPATRRALGSGEAGVLTPEIDRALPQYAMLLQLLRRALAEANEAAQSDLIGDGSLPMRLASVTLSAARGRPRTVAALIQAYRSDRERTYGRESTDRKYQHIFRALEEALGADKDISTLRREDCRQVRDLLRQVPTHCGKRYPKLTLRQAIAEADKGDVPRLAPNSVGSYLNNLSAIFNWAMAEEWLDRNPAKGLIERNRPKVKRRGFTSEELAKVFAALVREDRPSRFWVPALALFSGARAGEICQLRVEDVVVEGGVHCLDLSEFDQSGRRTDDKTMKTETSTRLVPLHPQLGEGTAFLRFVAQCREAGQERLFPDLQPGPKQSYSHEFSKWFGRFLNRIDLVQPSLVFHSFRHGFMDACRLGGVSDETAKALGGWAGTGQADNYGNRGMVPVLHRAACKADFRGFVLPLPR